MEFSKDQKFYSTTDEFSFDLNNELIQINFGPMRLQLTHYAAHDLACRLVSYLVFLQNREDSEMQNVDNTAAQESSEICDNVLMYPGRKKP